MPLCSFVCATAFLIKYHVPRHGRSPLDCYARLQERRLRITEFERATNQSVGTRRTYQGLAMHTLKNGRCREPDASCREFTHAQPCTDEDGENAAALALRMQWMCLSFSPVWQTAISVVVQNVVWQSSKYILSNLSVVFSTFLSTNIRVSTPVVYLPDFCTLRSRPTCRNHIHSTKRRPSLKFSYV